MIPQSFVQDLLNRVDIVDVVGKYVQLKKGGINLMGLCPFHKEKSPSFTVSPSKQFYHCFGCGVHGSALGFLIEYSGMSFPEAVRDLAQSVGMQVPEQTGTRPAQEIAQERSRSQSLYDVLQQAEAFYRKQLRASPRAIEYLKKRGLSGEIAARFGMGYAPDGWTALQECFTGEPGYDDPLIDAAALVRVKDNDGRGARRYDVFRDRIVFPIRNTRGNVIAFGGRVIDQGEPKYLNSPETEVFKKGEELYGLFEARQGIRERGCAIVVEGYMDVVALAQLDVPNAVATLGTACTPTHVQKLVRITDRIIFSFDGDTAGRNAAWRALQAALPHATDTRTIQFLTLPREHDPDTYVREHGRTGFESACDAAAHLSDFLFDTLTEKNGTKTAEARARITHTALPLVGAMPASLLQKQLLGRLADLTQLSVHDLTEQLDRLAAQNKRVYPAAADESAPPVLDDAPPPWDENSVPAHYEAMQSSANRSTRRNERAAQADRPSPNTQFRPTNQNQRGFKKSGGWNSWRRDAPPPRAPVALPQLVQKATALLLAHPPLAFETSEEQRSALAEQAHTVDLARLIDWLDMHRPAHSGAVFELARQTEFEALVEPFALQDPTLAQLQEPAQEWHGALRKLELQRVVTQLNALVKHGLTDPAVAQEYRYLTQRRAQLLASESAAKV